MISINARLATPPLPDMAFRRQLEAIRDRLAELEDACPPELGLDVALDVLEIALAGLGWQPPPLSEHDRQFLASVGAL